MSLGVLDFPDDRHWTCRLRGPWRLEPLLEPNDCRLHLLTAHLQVSPHLDVASLIHCCLFAASRYNAMGDSILPTLWATSCVAVVVMAVRLIGRWSAVRHLTTGDYLTLTALACLFVRLGMIHTVLEYGSGNITTAYRESHSFTPQEIERRTIGSKLTIANRFFYNT